MACMQIKKRGEEKKPFLTKPCRIVIYTSSSMKEDAEINSMIQQKCQYNYQDQPHEDNSTLYTLTAFSFFFKCTKSKIPLINNHKHNIKKNYYRALENGVA